jgi:hypothetical protein
MEEELLEGVFSVNEEVQEDYRIFCNVNSEMNSLERYLCS